MQVLLKHRGREVGDNEVAFIRELLHKNPNWTRRRLSIEVCQHWGWKQTNGVLCDAQCRGLLLALHRAGHVELPPPRIAYKPSRRTPAPVEIDQTPLESPLSSLGAIELHQVRRTPRESLVNSLIEHHHYLRYSQPVGEHLKYLVTADERPIGCFCWSSAPRHLAPRDKHIGWSADARKANIRFVAYQTRFLILPWVRVPHLASHLLGRMSRQLSQDWQQLYSHPVYFTETFVDPERNSGTCYRAANWLPLGLTKGRGKDDQTKKQNRSLKMLFGLPLVRDFRSRLCTVGSLV